MFTGIVQGKGTLVNLEKGEHVHTLIVQLPDASGLLRGASVALNGVCLTATEHFRDGGRFRCYTRNVATNHPRNPRSWRRSQR